MTLHYDAEANWVINTHCHFNCTYCFFGVQPRRRPTKLPISIEQIVRFFNNTGLTWLIHITGGEPFLYSELVELCRRLSEHHFIAITSNIDLEKVYHFAATIDPSRVDSFHCSLHIVEREKRQRVPDFIDKVLHLRKKGFNTFVSYVLYPPLLKRFYNDFAFFKNQGVILVPKLYRGFFDGQSYPAAYTSQERILYEQYLTMAQTDYDIVLNHQSGTATIDLSLDQHLLKGIPDFKGYPCYSGQRFIRIVPDGTINRCGTKTILGNLFEQRLELLSGPQDCQEEACPYFCMKYSAMPLPLPKSNWEKCESFFITDTDVS